MLRRTPEDIALREKDAPCRDVRSREGEASPSPEMRASKHQGRPRVEGLLAKACAGLVERCWRKMTMEEASVPSLTLAAWLAVGGETA